MLAQAIALQEDLTRGTKLLMTAPLIARLAQLAARRFRRQARWLKETEAESLNSYPEDPSTLAAIEQTLTQAHDAGWLAGAAMLGVAGVPRGVLFAGFLAGIDRTTEERLASGGLRDAFKGLAERAETVGLTEIGRAFNAGTIAAAADAPFSVDKVWLVQDKPCALCQAAAGEGPIPQEAPFRIGYFAPPGHPNCGCSLSLIPH